MSRFTSVKPSDAPTSGAMSDALTANALTVAGAAGLAGVGVMSLAVTATVLPAQTVALAGASTALVAAGRRQAAGKSIVPDFGSMFQRKDADAKSDTKSDAKSDTKAEPEADTKAEPEAVTDTASAAA